MKHQWFVLPSLALMSFNAIAADTGSAYDIYKDHDSIAYNVQAGIELARTPNGDMSKVPNDVRVAAGYATTCVLTAVEQHLQDTEEKRYVDDLLLFFQYGGFADGVGNFGPEGHVSKQHTKSLFEIAKRCGA